MKNKKLVVSGTPGPEPLKTWELDTRKATRSAEFRSLYTNFIAVNMTQHEISLLACEIAPHANGPEMVELVRLMMSPSFAKTLSLTLAKNVQHWEQNFGGAKASTQPPEEGKK